jgi:CDP-paratose synthetase
MNVLLTGATGFLGSHLLDDLILQGHRTIILKRSTSDMWRLRNFEDKFISYDIDNTSIELAFKEHPIDIVIHTACHYGRDQSQNSEIAETNLMFGLRVLDASLRNGVKAFINTDTMLPRKLNAYSLSKKQFVEWLQVASEKIQIVNLKIEHMYGPKDDVTKFIPWVISQFQQNVSEIKLTKGEQLRDFIYINDVVSVYRTVFGKLHELNRINDIEVGSGRLISVKEFLTTLKDIYETKFSSVQTKLNFGAIPYRLGELMRVEIDNSALRALGWAPKIDLYHGIENILEELQ